MKDAAQLSILDVSQTTASNGLVGIARLAAEADPLREGHHVEYFSLPARSVLSRVAPSARVPFQWAINPYRGCEFGCKYCYARYTHEFMELRAPADFEQQIFVKNFPATLRAELKHVKHGEAIAIGTATDPYQPAERRYEVTRKLLEILSLYEGLDLGIITKSTLVTRDIDLLKQISERNRLHVSLTITTLDADLARKLEPRAPRPDLRLQALERLRVAGIPAGVSCAPILPGINDDPRDLDRLVKAAANAGAQYVWANVLFLKDSAAAVLMPWIAEHYPHLLEGYKKRFDGRAFLPRAIAERTQFLVRRLETKHGIRRQSHSTQSASRPEWPLPTAAPQLEMFAAS